MPSFNDLGRMRVARALQAVNAVLPSQWGLRRPPVGTFSTISGANVTPLIDADTGLPVEVPDFEEGDFFPGNFPDEPGRGLV